MKLTVTPLAVCPALALMASSVTAQLPPGTMWALRYADEFNDTHDGNIMGLDPAKWNPAYPWTRVHNYPAYIRDENILVNTNDNGLLQLWSKRENFGGQPFTSGAINSNGKLNLGLIGRSGYMEARMKMPNYLGTWPAFWALQSGWPPEIDMMEFVRNGPGSPNESPNNYVANVHFNTGSGNQSSWSGFKNAGVGDLTAAFHNFGCRWTDNTLTWYVDGNQFHSYTGPAAIATMTHMYLILNHGIGGWPGDPPPDEDVNKSFDVDWVRVWQAAGPAQTNYVGGSGTQSWDNNANWSASSPQLASTTAFFGMLAAGGSAFIDWSNTRTAGGLTFRTASNYQIGGTDDHLMLSAWGGGPATEALIDVQANAGGSNGTHTIGSRLELHSDTRVRNATANTLSFTGNVYGNGALVLDSGKTSFGGGVFNRGGISVVGSADATFAGRLGSAGSGIFVGTTAGSNSIARVNSTVTTVSANHLRIGDAGGTGSFRQLGGAVTVSDGEVWVGQGSGSNGSYMQSGGSLTLSNWLAIGRQGATGTYSLAGPATLTKLGAGNLIIGSLGGTGSFVQTQGNVSVQSGNTLLGEDAGASGTYTISGGSAVLREIVLSQRGTGSGTFNLNGGTVEAIAVRRAGTGAATFNFHGGTLKPAAASTTFMQGLTAAIVKGNGATIDTSGLDITIAQPLLHDSLLAVPDGGLTKRGDGTLTLTGDHTYTGTTVVTGGKLALTQSLTSSSAVSANHAAIELTSSASANKVIKTPLVSVSNGGRIDLRNNKLITGTPAGTANAGVYDGLQGLVQSASNGGAWNGPGITTSMADALSGLTSIGVATGEQIRGLGQGETDLFAGQVISGASIIAMYTYAGDANLDGFISGDDYSAIDFASGVAGASGWFNGDFNYDGLISGDDYSAIDFNLVAQGAPFPTGGSAGFSGVATVPEPSACGVAAVAAALLARRHRRSYR